MNNDNNNKYSCKQQWRIPPNIAFVSLGLKIIFAKFGEDWTTCVGGVEKKRFSINSKWRPHQFGYYHKLLWVTHGMSQDIMRQRNHWIKANKSIVIGQNTFLLPAATPSDHSLWRNPNKTNNNNRFPPYGGILNIAASSDAGSSAKLQNIIKMYM